MNGLKLNLSKIYQDLLDFLFQQKLIQMTVVDLVYHCWIFYVSWVESMVLGKLLHFFEFYFSNKKAICYV
jgi:hypothetical protein